MKAAIINHYGTPEVLQIKEVEKPQIEPDQMLVKVHASSVNPIDWKIRKGLLKNRSGDKFPMLLGYDLSGEVIEVGDRIYEFHPGDLIYARLDQSTGGAYAEYAAVSKRVAAAKPNNMTHEEAATVPLAGMTALQALQNEGNIQAGHKVLINGASGGVGIFAVQIAKAFKTEVTAVCSGSNVEMVQSLGADRVIDYKQQDFTEDNVKYDIVFDVVGNRKPSECKSVLTPDGVYITTQPTPEDKLDEWKQKLMPNQKAEVIMLQSNSQDLVYLTREIEAGKIKTVIDRTYPLSEIADAHAYSETEHASGKIAIAISMSNEQ
jgi:NADPH:quinone reductase-like Zn-dependent oxidoreductase